MSNYVAGRMASKKAEGLLAPLLSDDESSTDSNDDDDSEASSKFETAKKSPMQKLKELLVYVGLAAGAAGSVGAMVLYPATILFVSGGICVANIPYAAIKERQIGKIPSLRAMNNKLREDANNLTEEVDILSEEIDILEPEADRAAAVEEQLRDVCDRQEVNVNKLVDLVKENEVILQKMRDNLRQRIVQDIITIVVKSDRDNDQTIDRSEAKTLALRIRLSLQEYGVEFNSEKFLKAIGSNATVQGVIAIVQKLLPQEERREDYDSDMDSVDSDEEEDDDIYDMFYMAEDFAATESVAGSRSHDEPMVGHEERRISLMTCDRKKSNRSMRRKGSRGDKRW